MARFQIDFEREVVQVDRITRVIDAANEQHAKEIAATMACEFDMSCPDDVTVAEDGSGECQSWMVHAVDTTNEPLSDTDEATDAAIERERVANQFFEERGPIAHRGRDSIPKSHRAEGSNFID